MKKYLLIACFALFLISCKNYDTLKWTAINVNSTGKQGDAHLISYQGHNFMIDTGQKYYTISTLIPYLKKHNIFNIDGVLITHPHFDHYGGLLDLLNSKNIRVKKIYMNMPTQKQMKQEWWGGKYNTLLNIIKKTQKLKIPVKAIKKRYV